MEETKDVVVTEEEKVTKAPSDEVTDKFLGSLKKVSDYRGFESEKARLGEMKNALISSGSLDVADAAIDYVDKRILDFSLDEIRKMNQTKFDETFVFNGEPIRFGEDRDFRFTKASVVYFKEMDDASKKIDECLIEMDKEYAKAQVEMEEIIKEFGSYDNIMRLRMKEEVNSKKEGSPERRQAQKMLDYYDDSFKLTMLEDWVRKEPPEIWERLMTDISYSKMLFRRFEEKANKYHLAINMDNIKRYLGMEKHVLPEKYHGITNTFLLIWIYYASMLRDGRHNAPTKLYLITIGARLKHLNTGASIFSEEEREEFIQSIQRVLDCLDIERLAKLTEEATARERERMKLDPIPEDKFALPEEEVTN